MRHFAAVVALLAAACSSSEPPCNIETGAGCALEVLQVLVSNAVADDDVSGLKLIYGTHRDVNVCGGDADPPCPAGTTCQALDASDVEHCADASGRQPGALAVPISGAEIRVVFSQLLDAASVADPDGALRPGVATLRCGGDFAYELGPRDGEYTPAGNGFLGAARGLDGLGPALVLRPATTLPLASVCTVSLAAGIRARGGALLSEPAAPLSFHTR